MKGHSHTFDVSKPIPNDPNTQIGANHIVKWKKGKYRIGVIDWNGNLGAGGDFWIHIYAGNQSVCMKSNSTGACEPSHTFDNKPEAYTPPPLNDNWKVIADKKREAERKAAEELKRK